MRGSAGLSPCLHGDKVGHEAGDDTGEYPAVAENDVGRVDIRLVGLRDHWRGERDNDRWLADERCDDMSAE